MKLRLRDNSIRLRLQISEIARLRETGSVTEKIQFSPTQILTYSILVDNASSKISSSFTGNQVVVKIPEKLAKPWLEADEVGLETSQVINEKHTLNILLEKDFKCLTPRADEVDMFPNPEEFHV